jgi:hypothetical protein
MEIIRDGKNDSNQILKDLNTQRSFKVAGKKYGRFEVNQLKRFYSRFKNCDYEKNRLYWPPMIDFSTISFQAETQKIFSCRFHQSASLWISNLIIKFIILFCIKIIIFNFIGIFLRKIKQPQHPQAYYSEILIQLHNEKSKSNIKIFQFQLHQLFQTYHSNNRVFFSFF